MNRKIGRRGQTGCDGIVPHETTRRPDPAAPVALLPGLARPEVYASMVHARAGSTSLARKFRQVWRLQLCDAQKRKKTREFRVTPRVKLSHARDSRNQVACDK
ncbi:MAG TPA: hypothetical protein VF573_04895 [Paraburkholderia sp.]|uniref:hypothetical protein n=1 Tax=Paraburkholderia sp. TaxID=1926495 RepID=UPI002ED4ADDA